MDFHQGQKVVCIRGFRLAPPLVAVPEVGREYVVRAVSRELIPPYLWGLRLHWLINPPVLTVDAGVTEQYFCIHGLDGLPNFKPVIERRTDISVFDYHLIPTNVRAPERV